MENALAVAPAPRLPRARRFLATAGAVTSAASFSLSQDDWPNPFLLPVGLLLVSAALLWRRDLGSQLLARAIWWSNLLLGTLIAISAHASEQRLGVTLALGSGLALLVLGRLGVDDADRAGAFVPVALRGTLTASLVMALADAQTLLLFGGVVLYIACTRDAPPRSVGAGALLTASGVALTLAGYGLFRLRGWAVLLNLFANLVLVGAVLGNVGDLPQPLRLGWAATAGIQLLLMTRLLLAFRAGAPSSPRRLPTSTTMTSALVVLALLATAIACAALHVRLMDVR